MDASAKRKAEELAENGSKKPRLDGAGGVGIAAAGGAAGGTTAPKKPGIDLEKLKKAKLALQKQKELAEKLKKAGIKTGNAAAAAAATAPAAAAPPPLPPPSVPALAAAHVAALSGLHAGSNAAKKAKLPPPLLLDDQGRELDPFTGKPKQAAAGPSAPSGLPAPGQPAAAAAAAQAPEEDARHFDPGIGSRELRRMQRRPRAEIKFVDQGQFEKQAEVARLRAKFGDQGVRQLEERKRREAEMAAEGVDANLIPLGTRAGAGPSAGEGEVQPEQPQHPREAVPEVEWWDARILADRAGGYGGLAAAAAEGRQPEPLALKEGRITNLVEHPVLVEPPAEAPPPPPQPLKLTKREVRKLRTQRRLAREKEKQELIQQGLLEPPAPKVKISNLMRVMGEQATADPTAIEAEVRRQMADRQAAHDDRNLARMLTPAERKDKKLRKLLDDKTVDCQVALYKIGSLAHPQLRFKVDVNAKENHLTGTALIADDFCLVVVEGGPKTLRRYEKLMLRRINWEQEVEAGEEEEGEQGGEGGAAASAKGPNYCHLVWQGVLKQPHFKKFKVETVHTEAAARQFLSGFNVAHYWDLAANYSTEV